MAEGRTRVFSHYRESSLGLGLIDTLEILVREGHITQKFSDTILDQFDKSISESLANISSSASSKCHIIGHLHTYRFCGGVWTFILKNTTLQSDREPAPGRKIPVMKIICVDTQPPKL